MTVSFPLSDGDLLALHVSGAPNDRPTLVLLHPDHFDSRIWDLIRPAFQTDYRVVAIDRRGHGGSSPARGPYDRSAELTAVLEATAPCPAAIIGAGEGADDALRVVMDGHIRPSALVLAYPVVLWMTNAFIDTESKRIEFEKEVEGWLDSADAEPFLALAELDENQRATKMIEMVLATLPEGHPALPLVATMLADNAHTMFDEPLSDDDHDALIAALASVNTPTLVVAEPEDRIAAALTQRLPDATLRVLPTVAGLPSLEEPERFQRLVIEFLLERV